MKKNSFLEMVSQFRSLNRKKMALFMLATFFFLYWTLSPKKIHSVAEEIPISYFCSQRDKPPFLVLPALTGGLFNQWICLHSSLYYALGWIEGTVVFFDQSQTRLNFSYPPQMKVLGLEDIFDVVHLVRFLRLFKISSCVASDEWIRLNPPSIQIPSYVFSREDVQDFDNSNLKGYSPFMILNTTQLYLENQGLSWSSPNLKIYGPKNFGGAFVPMNIEDYYDKRLSFTRAAALAIQFQPNIREIAEDIFREINRKYTHTSIIGLHLRLEADWDRRTDQQVFFTLHGYTKQIKKLKDSLMGKCVIYFAHGDLEPSVAGIVGNWIRNLSNVLAFPCESISKNSFKSDVSLLNIEQQAAVDSEVLINCSHFIGCAESSMSYVVYEKRNYIGLPSLMTRSPGFNIWWPIYAPSVNPWRFIENENSDVDVDLRKATNI